MTGEHIQQEEVHLSPLTALAIGIVLIAVITGFIMSGGVFTFIGCVAAAVSFAGITIASITGDLNIG